MTTVDEYLTLIALSREMLADLGKVLERIESIETSADRPLRQVRGMYRCLSDAASWAETISDQDDKEGSPDSR